MASLTPNSTARNSLTPVTPEEEDSKYTYGIGLVLEVTVTRLSNNKEHTTKLFTILDTQQAKNFKKNHELPPSVFEQMKREQLDEPYLNPKKYSVCVTDILHKVGYEKGEGSITVIRDQVKQREGLKEKFESTYKQTTVTGAKKQHLLKALTEDIMLRGEEVTMTPTSTRKADGIVRDGLMPSRIAMYNATLTDKDYEIVVMEYEDNRGLQWDVYTSHLNPAKGKVGWKVKKYQPAKNKEDNIPTMNNITVVRYIRHAFEEAFHLNSETHGKEATKAYNEGRPFENPQKDVTIIEDEEQIQKKMNAMFSEQTPQRPDVGNVAVTLDYNQGAAEEKIDESPVPSSDSDDDE